MPDGSVGQSGFFNAALGGTDLSRTAAAALVVNDAVSNSTTTITSVSALFTAPMLGNGVILQGDGEYEIRAVVSATQITVDRNTGAGTGQTLRVGGATTIAGSGFQPIFRGTWAAGHKQWVRRTNSAGVLTAYAATNPVLSTAGTTLNPITTEGYNLVRGDGGRAVINHTGWSFSVSGNANIVKNLELSTVSGTLSTLHLTAAQCHLENLILDPGTSNGPGLLQDGGAANNNVLRRVWAKGPSAAGGGTSSGDLAGTGCLYEYCEFSGSLGQNGVSLNSVAQFWGCLFRDNAGAGVRQNAAVGSQFKGCEFWNNGTDGLRLTNSTQGLMDVVVENSIFGMNAGYDLNYTPSDISANAGAIEWAKNQVRCNWFYTTGAGRYHQLPAGSDDTALTVNPFVSSSTGNFSLNTLTGGGAAITAAPCAVAFPDGLNSASVLGGFYGVVPTPGGTTGALATLISLFRERTNERLYPATNSGISDATVCIYLDWAAHWLNRIARYHYTTDTTTIALVAGQQEYTAPTDLVEAKWLRYGLRDMQRGSVERWRGDDLNWAAEQAAEPREWAMYGGFQIVLRPTPSAEAVAANPTCTLRYVSTPPAMATSGPDQLPTQAYRILVDYAAAVWNISFPDTALAEQRAAALLKEATEQAQLFAMEMSQRDIAR